MISTESFNICVVMLLEYAEKVSGDQIIKIEITDFQKFKL